MKRGPPGSPFLVPTTWSSPLRGSRHFALGADSQGGSVFYCYSCSNQMPMFPSFFIFFVQCVDCTPLILGLVSFTGLLSTW